MTDTTTDIPMTLSQRLLKIQTDLAEVASDVLKAEAEEEPISCFFEHPSFEGQIRVEMLGIGALYVTSTVGRTLSVQPRSSGQVVVKVLR